MTAPTTGYLPKTEFNPDNEASAYEVEIDADGPVVYSECCLDRISLGTAVLLHEALGRWIADQQGAKQTAPDTDAQAGLVGALLAQAVTPTERGAISRTALLAGFLWRCHPCKQDHLATTEACGCGAPRPTHPR